MRAGCHLAGSSELHSRAQEGSSSTPHVGALGSQASEMLSHSTTGQGLSSRSGLDWTGRQAAAVVHAASAC